MIRRGAGGRLEECQARRAVAVDVDGARLSGLMPETKTGRAREKAAAAVGASPHYVQDAKKLRAAAPTWPTKSWPAPSLSTAHYTKWSGRVHPSQRLPVGSSGFPRACQPSRASLAEPLLCVLAVLDLLEAGLG